VRASAVCVGHTGRLTAAATRVSAAVDATFRSALSESPGRALAHQRARRGGVRRLLSVIPRRGMWLALGLVTGLFGECEGPRWPRGTALAYDLQIFSNS
jgi:hypothetical protein